MASEDGWSKFLCQESSNWHVGRRVASQVQKVVVYKAHRMKVKDDVDSPRRP
jgi:hypothetical protein